MKRTVFVDILLFFSVAPCQFAATFAHPVPVFPRIIDRMENTDVFIFYSFDLVAVV